MGAGAEALAVDDAGGDGQHVLQRAPQLDADKIARPVKAELGAAKTFGEQPPHAFVGARHGERRRQAARYIGRKAGARERGAHRMGQFSGEDVAHHLP